MVNVLRDLSHSRFAFSTAKTSWFPHQPTLNIHHNNKITHKHTRDENFMYIFCFMFFVINCYWNLIYKQCMLDNVYLQLLFFCRFDFCMYCITYVTCSGQDRHFDLYCNKVELYAVWRADPISKCWVLFYKLFMFVWVHEIEHNVSYMRRVGGFLRVFRFPPPIKLKYCWKWR